jgi:KamA family protein
MPAESFTPVNRRTLARAPQWRLLSEEQREAVDVVARVLPFRTNRYVLEELIDWSAVPDDPVFRLYFPHRDMLREEEYRALRDRVRAGDEAAAGRIVAGIRARMNPHPAGQLTHNVPARDGEPLPGLQHKYRQTVLFFPSAGQTCHAYCAFCFRWAQFVGDGSPRFAAADSGGLADYLRAHREVTDVLITGGDPLIMRTRTLERFVEPLLSPDLAHVRNIRIGTKSVAHWPQRFVTDEDAGELLRLFERVTAHGRHLAIMGHYSHPAELRTDVARSAVRRILDTGAALRMQAPVLRHVNDDPAAWSELWTQGVRLGAVPYYMFVERDTGPRSYFELPLVRAYEIFRDAYRTVSGLARTVRGPSMSTVHGKVQIDGVPQVGGRRVFALQYLQARDPGWVRRPFHADFDETATWFDQLKPAFAEDRGAFGLQDWGV